MKISKTERRETKEAVHYEVTLQFSSLDASIAINESDPVSQGNISEKAGNLALRALQLLATTR